MSKYTLFEISDPSIFKEYTAETILPKFLFSTEISDLVLQFYLEQIDHIDQMPDYKRSYEAHILNYLGDQWHNFYQGHATLVLIKNKQKLVGAALYLIEDKDLVVPLFAVSNLDYTNIIVFLINNLLKNKKYTNLKFVKPLQSKTENIFLNNKFNLYTHPGHKLEYYSRPI